MRTRFYNLKKRFDELSELSESGFVGWLNDSILTDMGAKIRPIDDDEEWEMIRKTVGGARNLANIIAKSVDEFTYSYADSWFMYDPSERIMYSFSGTDEIKDFFEELICDEIENADE